MRQVHSTRQLAIHGSQIKVRMGSAQPIGWIRMALQVQPGHGLGQLWGLWLAQAWMVSSPSLIISRMMIGVGEFFMQLTATPLISGVFGGMTIKAMTVLVDGWTAALGSFPLHQIKKELVITTWALLG